MTISVIKHYVLSRLEELKTQAKEYTKLHPASIKYTGVTAKIEELEHIKDLIERLDK